MSGVGREGSGDNPVLVDMEDDSLGKRAVDPPSQVSLVDMKKSFGQKCAWYPACKQQVGQCGGRTKSKCSFFGKGGSLENVKMKGKPVSVKVEEMKKEMEKSNTEVQRNRRILAVARKHARSTGTNGKHEWTCLESPTVFLGPYATKENPTTDILILESECAKVYMRETMITDGPCNAYMNLLVHRSREMGCRLRIVQSGFMFYLEELGWNKVKGWVKKNQWVKDDWMTAPLIFVPIFVGKQNRGHWMGLIVDRTIVRGKTVLLFADSLGQDSARGSCKDLQNHLRDSPFGVGKEGVQWINVDFFEQYGNDCGVCMLHFFASWFKFKCCVCGERENLDGVKARLKTMSATAWGSLGRKHILRSLQGQNVELRDDSIKEIEISIW